MKWLVTIFQTRHEPMREHNGPYNPLKMDNVKLKVIVSAENAPQAKLAAMKAAEKYLDCSVSPGGFTNTTVPEIELLRPIDATEKRTW